MRRFNVKTPDYDEEELLYELAEGMGDDDMADRYDWTPVEQSLVIADLKYNHDVKRMNLDGEWVWVYGEPLENVKPKES